MKKGGNTHGMDSLADVLFALGSKRPFLKEIKIQADGGRQPFTQSGAKAYGLLIEILYCVGALCECDDVVSDMIEMLDGIADGVV